MSDGDRETAVQKPIPAEKPKFDEAPGEAEADAVRDAFLKGAGSQPEQVASTLSLADSATRSRVISRLQEQKGNGYVQRVAQAGGAPGRLVGLPQSEMVAEVQRRKGAGMELAQPARQSLENHLGADLGDVRVHADGEAAALSRELEAQAFTVGRDVFMAEGQYNPTSKEGQGLLAHELTHVAQQSGLNGPGVQREGVPEEEELQRQEEPEEEEMT